MLGRESKRFTAYMFRALTPSSHQTELTLTEGAIASVEFPNVQIHVKKMFTV
jgi:hypothetical protein